MYIKLFRNKNRPFDKPKEPPELDRALSTHATALLAGQIISNGDQYIAPIPPHPSEWLSASSLRAEVLSAPSADFLTESGISFVANTGGYIVTQGPGHGLNFDYYVRNTEGGEYYVSTKDPHIQDFVARLGQYMASEFGGVDRLSFPDTKQDTFNGENIVMVERFRDVDEYDGLTNPEVQQLTGREMAFLKMYNLFVQNRDFKDEHILVSRSGDSVGLIDFELSLDFYDLKDYSPSTEGYGYLADVFQAKIPDSDWLDAQGFFSNLEQVDLDKILQIAQLVGLTQSTAESLTRALWARRDIMSTWPNS